jgi:hypothetical protein
MSLNDGLADDSVIFREWLMEFSADRMLKQELEDWARPVHYEGEKRLMYRVLEDGLDTLVKNDMGRRHGHDTRDAHRWVFDRPSNHEWPFTFENCCDAFKLDPSYMRRIIRQWLDRRTLMQRRNKSWVERRRA